MFVYLACTTGEVNRERTEDVDTLYRPGDGRQGGISTSATERAPQALRPLRRRHNPSGHVCDIFPGGTRAATT